MTLEINDEWYCKNCVNENLHNCFDCETINNEIINSKKNFNKIIIKILPDENNNINYCWCWMPRLNNSMCKECYIRAWLNRK